MAVALGTRLGPYEITARIGEGGMGEVYRARDTKLQRDVAIKVLPEAVAHDSERLARFEREARTLAALNHPHIAQVYGFETSGDMNALVMELVEGPTLADRIAHGPLLLDEAVPIARQIVQALEAAHEQGIIHRDLKPANIKVRTDGTVKVLDFGLAKAMEPAGVATANVTLSPTITTPAMTQMGMILGTAAYMSPEQAKGRAADKRSDIWAFGCVVYEMLTGKRAFDGEDMTDVLGAVVRLEPDWQALSPEIPASLRTLLQQCLVKDRRGRIADIAAARFVLEHQALASTGPASIAALPHRPLWQRIALVSGVALVAAGIAATAMWLATRQPASRPIKTTIATEGPAALTLSGVWRDVVITPDGSRIIYSGNNQLLIRALDDLAPTVLTRGVARSPFVSPDGQWVGYFERSALKKVAVTGGPPVTIASIAGDGAGATWRSDGTIIFATGDASSGLQQVSADGGTPTVLTKPAADERDHVWPEFLPGGDAVLFTIFQGGVDNTLVALFDLKTRTYEILIRGGSQASYMPTGHLIYGVAGTLRAVSFDLERRDVIGTAVPVLDGVVTTRTGAVDVGVAANGTLVYVPGVGGARRTVVSLDRQGRASPLPNLQGDIYRQVRVSPDGSRLALTASNDIGIYEFARAALSPLTTEPGPDANPLWTPDSQHIVYTNRNRAGNPELFWRPADGSGRATRLLTRSKDLTNLFATSWSKDGTRLLFTEVAPDLQSVIGQITFERPSDETMLVNGQRGVVSPDGRWIAYESSVSGRFQINVERYPELGNRVTISTEGGRDPRWSADGKELFFGSDDGARMFSVTVTPGDKLVAGSPQMIFESAMIPFAAGDQPYDVAPDGRFLVIRSEATGAGTASAPTLVLIQNWFEELKRLVR